ncbi:hypothetical protein IAR50_005494 [Cryptococcus sp. DSM 104548]
MTAQVAARDASQPLVYCRWDFCSQAFTTYNDWEVHFEVEHMPNEKAQDFSGKMRRRRHDGQWELVDQDSSSASENLVLSGGTGESSLAMSMPTFTQAVSDSQGHMDPRMIFPPQRSPDLDDHDQLGPEDEYLNLDGGMERRVSASLPETGAAHSQQSEGQQSHSSEASPHDAALHTSQPQYTTQLFWDQNSLTKPHSPNSSPSAAPLSTPAQRTFMERDPDVLASSSKLHTTQGGAGQASSGGFRGHSSGSHHMSPEKKTPSGSLESKSNSDSPKTIQWGGATTAAAGKKDTPRAQEKGMDRGGIGFGFANK